MAQTIQFRRGNEANLPSLAPGEPAITLDTEKVFIGGANENIEVARQAEVDALTSQLAQNVQRSKDIWFDVKKDFGLSGENGVDDTSKLKTAFNYARDNGSVKLYFPKGIYCFSGYVIVYANTEVVLHPEAVIKRIGSTYKMFTNGALGGGDSVPNGGYTGNGNIHFSGGTIDFNRQDFANYYGLNQGIGFFDLGHAQNISFTNMKFINARMGHFFQVASCKNVRFKQLSIEDIDITDTSTKDHECIQIEVASRLSFPSFGKYDDTPCRDILIEECTFDGVVRAIGTHSYVNTQTTTGSITAGSNLLTVADPSKFNVGENIFVYGAGATANAYISTTITAINGNVLTLGATAGTTVTDTKVANQTDGEIASVFNENVTIRNNRIKNASDSGIRLMGFKYARVENNVIEKPGGDGIYLSQVEDSLFNGNLIMNTTKTGLYMSRTYRCKFTNNILRELATGGGYAAIRLLTSNYNTFSGTTVTSITPAYNYAFYTSDGCVGNKITDHNFTTGTGGKIGAVDAAEYDNLVIGNGQDLLFSGVLNTAASTGTLTHDIRNYSAVVVIGNDNGSGTASLLSVYIPRLMMTIGSTVGRFRLITDDTNASDRGEFSFPTSKSIRLDTINGGVNIRKVIGIV